MSRPRTMKRSSRRRFFAPAPQVKRRLQPRLKRRPRRRRMAPELKRLIWIALAAMLVLGALLYPFELHVVPTWSVQVVDENEHPMPGIHVQQEWGQFGLDEMIWTETRVTGADGRVQFPERLVKAPLGPRALKYFLTSGIQPADDQNRQVPSSHLFVCQQGKTGELLWERGEGQPPERLLVHKGFCFYSAQRT